MYICFLMRENVRTFWGGDITAISAICKGMKKLGVKAEVHSNIAEMGKPDFVFLNGITTFDLNPHQTILDLLNIPYGIIPFYHDRLPYQAASLGFLTHVMSYFKNSAPFVSPKTPLFTSFNIDHALGKFEGNQKPFEQSRIFIANTASEKKELQERLPGCKAVIIPWTPGFAENFQTTTPTDEFLKLSGMSSGKYILQVGRIQPVKNQVGTILASRDLDIPLVFIATDQIDEYFFICLEAIQKWRKAPTLIIAQNFSSSSSSLHRVIKMPGGKKLSASMLQSAFFHAGLHIHPSFCEQPGLTYFESAYFGIPTIASNWTTISDYFPSPEDDRIEYADPHDIDRMTMLIQKKMGKKYPISKDPIFKRTSVDLARDYLAAIQM